MNFNPVNLPHRIFSMIRFALLFAALFIVSVPVLGQQHQVIFAEFNEVREDTAGAAVDTLSVPAPIVGGEVTEFQQVIGVLSGLESNLKNRIRNAEESLLDRTGAVEQRLAGVERRTDDTFLRISSFEQQFWYIIIALLFLSLVTVLSILILTFKFIEPMKKENKMLNESFIRLQAEIPKNSENIHQALKDLAKDDPYIAQILKKNKLL
ncbi:hypothetical protein CYPRO_1156 [Cyclonatronum proteinivorum]|uniref:Uncharacterized protein n=2 Tax=Cyclonatronum proteinivorum TaxID=1457365 RepID=A0A345UIW8_9BACT|nr:hypothetical protein CYPRO_1156 [Cyclonatronum proteinivorum]